MRRNPLILVPVAFAVALSACGGSDAKPTSESTAASAAVSAAATEPAPNTPETPAAAETSAAPETSTAPETSAAPDTTTADTVATDTSTADTAAATGLAKPGDAFCIAAKETKDLGDKVEFTATVLPDDLKAQYEAAAAAAKRARDLAPSDIKPLLDESVASQDKVYEILQRSGFDLAKAVKDPEFVALSKAESDSTRDDAIAAYLLANCGIEDDKKTTDTSTPTKIDLPEGEAGVKRFVELGIIGQGLETKPEDVACATKRLVEAGVTPESLEALMSGDGVDSEVRTQVGLAFIGCGIITPGQSS